MHFGVRFAPEKRYEDRCFWHSPSSLSMSDQKGREVVSTNASSQPTIPGIGLTACFLAAPFPAGSAKLNKDIKAAYVDTAQ